MDSDREPRCQVWVGPTERFDLKLVLAEPATAFLDGWLSPRDCDLPGEPSLWGMVLYFQP